MRRMAQECVPVIQGFSEHVIPKQPEWGEYVHTTGYWTLDESGWEPSDALLRYFETGEPPVFIGFGSMPVPEPQETTALILDALKQSGKRGILHAGWAKLGAAELPDTIFLLDYAPYAWLFPRMSAVIHHGGSGTTGLALRSGVPSMVIPFTADQPFWGARTHALGVGPVPIPFSRITAENLAQAFQIMAHSTDMQRQAVLLRDAMATENGVQQAVEVIQCCLP